MLVGQRMQPEVVTVTPGTSVAGASRLLQEHRIRHLPVVERGRLVGIITDRDIRRVLPSPATSLEVHELLYLLDRLTVGEVMTAKVITVTPETPIEEAARLLVDHRIGCLPVLQGDRLAGIITETDLLAALAEILGIRTSTARLEVVVEDTPGTLPAVCTAIAAKSGEVVSLFAARASARGAEVPVLVIRLEAPDVDEVVEAIREAGYRVLSVTW
ncbi:MAG TPA: CBS and ACT domain-containing protein [Candidatus Methylomirabilis sp.]|jgi:acetoin utilization protein AcuB|nr:CBS and ACT domain-containing protein [Candidatus Methylomirabilis sp.]